MTVFDLISMFTRYIHRINDTDVSQMCGLAEGTNAHTLKTTNQIYYSVYNQHGLIKAATDNIAMTTCAEQAISTFCYYLVSISASGSVNVTKGTDNTYALPATPGGTIQIGAFKVTTDASHTFTSGSTDLSATGITAVFYDIDTGIALYLINQAMQRLERGVTVIHDGRSHYIADFQHMLVRADIGVIQGDSSITIPFSGTYKDFVDDGLTIYDASANITYPIWKDDIIPLGTNVQNRPCRISRVPTTETTFTLDGAPAMEFDIWPESDNSYTINVIANQYSPSLDCVIYQSNWLTENTPDVLLFGALVEAASYFPAEPRISEWKERWNDAVWALKQAQEKEKFSGSIIATKFPNPLSNDGADGMSSSFAGISSYGYQNSGN